MSDDVTITVRVNDDTAAGFRDVNGRLRTLDGRFAATAGSMRRNSDDLSRSMGGLTSSTMSLTPALYGVAGALGVSLLPAVGAAVPAMIGAGAAAGTLKLGFAGVGKAVDLAGKDQKKYAEALKKMGPEQREFTQALVGVKKEFSGFGKDIQKAMLPGFTKAVKDAAPVVKIFGKGMTELGGAFGKAAEGAGKLFKDSGFQKDLQTNLDLGREFIGDMLSGLPKLGSSFLSFGAASKPTLTAISGGIRDVLGKGLPGMFDGLKVGIEGSSKMLDGFFNMVNSLLPAIGRFSGEVARSMGPLFGEMFTSLGVRGAGALDTLGQVVKGLTPVFKDLGYGLKSTTQLMQIIGPTVKDTASAIVGSLLPSFSEVDKAKGPLRRLSDAIQNNKGAIQEFARQGGTAFLTLVEVGVRNFPTLIRVFRLVTGGMVTALGGVLHAAASAFGWIPGIGGKLKAADEAFQGFKDSYLGALRTAENKATSFAASTGPKLAAGKLRLNISNWQSQIDTAKAKMRTVPPSKQAALKADIRDLEAKIAQAKRDLNNLDGKTATTYVRTVRVGGVYGNKQVPLSARGGLLRRAGGGPVQYFGEGGYVQGPGSGTSDGIYATFASGAESMVSNTEYVMKAAAVQKYGVKMMDAINEGRLPIARLAKGGLTRGEREARAELRDQFGISHFGSRAGYQRSPFEKALGAPSDLGALVSALNAARGDIRRATSGRTESHLLKELDSVGKSLIKYDRSLNKVNASLDKAKGKLDDLKNSASQLRDSVKSGVLSSANITQGTQGGPVTVASIMSGLTASRDKATAFAEALKGLQKKGLSKSLLQQIAEAGISGGGLETAGALLGASGSEIRSLNSLQSQISSAATSAGKTTADAVYGAAIKAQEKLVKSLQKQQDKLEKAMAHLAKVMERAISRAIGRKAAGGIVGAAAAGGVRGGLTWVGEHEPELLDIPVGSRVRSGPDSRRIAAGTGGGVVRVELEIRSGGSAHDEYLARELRKFVRVRGGNVQVALMGR